MLISKEKYLSSETLETDISLIYNELKGSNDRNYRWNASYERSAVIVTDLQNYFLNPESHAFIPSASAVLPNIKKLISFFKEINRPVIFTKHTNNKENAASMNYWWKDLIPENSGDAELYAELGIPGNIILKKHQYDAFHQTGLEDLLRENGVIYPVICGVMTNLCCETTTRSAFVRGFRPMLPLDATAAYNREFHIATFRNLGFGFSPLMNTEEVINILQS